MSDLTAAVLGYLSSKYSQKKMEQAHFICGGGLCVFLRLFYCRNIQPAFSEKKLPP
ncbi:hypothetical protein [Neisseria musculi]|uniref:hypothetical protein n=1 Tax=Neisseria musculi TaxID=1815583 RepID=UPI00164AC946|nr:hypothetical protein [Neisseria musculi]